jgi:hypothetical protein
MDLSLSRLLHKLSGILFVLFFLSGSFALAQTPPASLTPAIYIDDQAELVKTELHDEIVANCREIEEKMRIRVHIKTMRLANLSEGANQDSLYRP